MCCQAKNCAGVLLKKSKCYRPEIFRVSLEAANLNTIIKPLVCNSPLSNDLVLYFTIICTIQGNSFPSPVVDFLFDILEPHAQLGVGNHIFEGIGAFHGTENTVHRQIGQVWLGSPGKLCPFLGSQVIYPGVAGRIQAFPHVIREIMSFLEGLGDKVHGSGTNVDD